MSILSIPKRAAFNTRLRGLYSRLRSVPLLGSRLRQLANWLYPRGTREWVVVRTGVGTSAWMYLDARYEMGYRTGMYESAVQKVLVEHLRSGDIFYEVGAHIGFFSLLAAGLVDGSGEVVAFEADPLNVGLIQEHFRRNSLAHARVVPMAVWSKAGTVSFTRGSELSSLNAGGVLESSPWGFNTDVIEVEAIALDDYVQRHRPPSLVKIDVEGAELHVLNGAKELISFYKPLVLCEVHSPELASQVENLLTKNSYAVEWFADQTAFTRHLIARPNG
jgi:FkbM family methyltransferase